MSLYPFPSNTHPTPLGTNPEIIEADTQPDIDDNTMAFWRDTTNNITYLIVDRNGTQELVELAP